tara:strand:- start:224 stop:640 length:417 start_codon:yes stop_codon:yes gene_type:complete
MEKITIQGLLFYVAAKEGTSGVAIAQNGDEILLADSKAPGEGYISISLITLLKLMVYSRSKVNQFSVEQLQKISGYKKHLEDISLLLEGDTIQVISSDLKSCGSLEHSKPLYFGLNEWHNFMEMLKEGIFDFKLTVNE